MKHIYSFLKRKRAEKTPLISNRNQQNLLLLHWADPNKELVLQNWHEKIINLNFEELLSINEYQMLLRNYKEFYSKYLNSLNDKLVAGTLYGRGIAHLVTENYDQASHRFSNLIQIQIHSHFSHPEKTTDLFFGKALCEIALHRGADVDFHMIQALCSDQGISSGKLILIAKVFFKINKKDEASKIFLENIVQQIESKNLSPENRLHWQMLKTKMLKRNLFSRNLFSCLQSAEIHSTHNYYSDINILGYNK